MVCEPCDAEAVGGGHSALLLKCGSRFGAEWTEECYWECPLCVHYRMEVQAAACHSCTNSMACVGNAIRSALTPSRVAKAILSAKRTRSYVDPQAWERAFGPDYATRILWLSPACGAFRVAEDGTAADVDDRQLPLPPQPWLVATPRDIGAAEWERWQQLFADYDIISPIGQWT